MPIDDFCFGSEAASENSASMSLHTLKASGQNRLTGVPGQPWALRSSR